MFEIIELFPNLNFHLSSHVLNIIFVCYILEIAFRAKFVNKDLKKQDSTFFVKFYAKILDPSIKLSVRVFL